MRSPEGVTNPRHSATACQQTGDPETNIPAFENSDKNDGSSAFRSLGWLDRLLALWILLAMVIGILLGNFVPETGQVLKKGSFADVSVPIGK
jgi:arsenite transporter